MLISISCFQKLRTVKSSHDQVLNEMEKLNHQLKVEQNKVLKANNELKSGTANHRRIVEVGSRRKKTKDKCFQVTHLSFKTMATDLTF